MKQVKEERASLREQMRADIAKRRNGKNKDVEFEIVGVPKDLLDQNSDQDDAVPQTSKPMSVKEKP